MEEVCPVKTREIKLGGSRGLSAIVDESDFVSLNLGSYKWYQNVGSSTTYARTRLKGKTVLLHRLIMRVEDFPRSICVDHIDHNGLNNTKENLRITDNRGNSQNARKGKSSKNTSEYKGVSKHPQKKKRPWQATIYPPEGKKRKPLGYYKTEMEAAQAYNKAATELFGEFACLNVIP